MTDPIAAHDHATNPVDPKPTPPDVLLECARALCEAHDCGDGGRLGEASSIEMVATVLAIARPAIRALTPAPGVES